MSEKNPPSEPVQNPASTANGSEEAKPLSPLEVYRKERAEMHAARLKLHKDRADMTEAIQKASAGSALLVPDKPMVEELPVVSEAPENQLFLRQAETQMVPDLPESKWRRTLLSAFVFIGLPVLIAAIYFGLIASDQYAATAQFSIHSNTPVSASGSQTPSGLAAMLAGGAGGGAIVAVVGEMFVVQGYVNSPQILIDIKPKLNLRAIYSNPVADYWARLPAKANDRQLLSYWKTMVTVQVDNNTGIGLLTVKAFTPQDSKNIADAVLSLSEALVNKMSDRSQKDTIDLAQKEVDSASARVQKAHEALNAFFVEQSQATGRPATEMLSTRDRLNQELNFAEQAYGAALTTRQSASAVAMVRGLYLEPFVKPQVADYAEYPARSQSVLLTFLVCSLLWIVGLIVVSATKEHL